jgi:hypothetical protein
LFAAIPEITVWLTVTVGKAMQIFQSTFVIAPSPAEVLGRPRLPHNLVEAIIAIVRALRRFVIGWNYEHLAAIKLDARNLEAGHL